MPIGKIAQTSGKGADYSAGSVSIEHGTQQSKSITYRMYSIISCCMGSNNFCHFPHPNNIGGGKAVGGYQKTDAQHSYGAGALNITAQTDAPKVKENLGIGKGEGAGTSSYGAGAVSVEQAKNAPKIKHEGLGQVDKQQEQVHGAGGTGVGTDAPTY